MTGIKIEVEESQDLSPNHRNKWWKNVKCFSYQEIGHMKTFCPKRSKKTKDLDETKRRSNSG